MGPPDPRANDANAPAVVLYGPFRTAVVLHPEGDAHPNAGATRDHLGRRGYTVVPVPRDLAPFLAGASAELRERVRQILRDLAAAA